MKNYAKPMRKNITLLHTSYTGQNGALFMFFYYLLSVVFRNMNYMSGESIHEPYECGVNSCKYKIK